MQRFVTLDKLAHSLLKRIEGIHEDFVTEHTSSHKLSNKLSQVYARAFALHIDTMSDEQDLNIPLDYQVGKLVVLLEHLDTLMSIAFGVANPYTRRLFQAVGLAYAIHIDTVDDLIVED